MDAARLPEVEAIFHAALDAGPGDRERILEQRCGGDPELRREVEALLAAHERSGAFFEKPVATLDDGLFAEDGPDRMIGRTIGRYEITVRIGSGGMGAVYLARRADRQYEKQVAVKLIKRGMDTEAVLRRFRNERQILAGLEHPNIARLLDGGTTDDGLPYFVMEYVEGVPIDEYCSARGLGVAERLALFRSICCAVSYAHRHAVIHRDLKPSNILVDADGVPKLLDFGIATLLEASDAPEAQATLLGQRVMTPEYASPEHLRGEPETTASDVYSLGVVLYRLLAGQVPSRARGRLAGDAERAVDTAAAPKPSAAADARTGRQLRGDLDNIVLMALRDEPQRRYSSVEQFSEDIRRHLESLPVLARRDTLAYRAGRFVRRNVAASVAAALVVLSLVGGILMTTREAQRADRQKAIALAEKARAERRFNEVRRLAHSVLFDYHDAIKDLSGATAIRERLVKDGLAYLDGLASEAGGDPGLQRELAAAYDRVGDVRGRNYAAASLGDLAGATDSYRKALRIRESLAASNPGDWRDLRDLAVSYRKVGNQLVATRERESGMAYLRKGLSILEKLAVEQPGDPGIRRELAVVYDALGLAEEDSGNLAAAEDYHRKFLALYEALSSADPGDPALRRSLAIGQINLGRALALGGDFEAAIASNRKGLEISETLVAANPGSADYRRLLANAYQNDGDYRRILHDVNGALLSFRRKLALDQQALTEDPDNAVARMDIAYSRLRIGELQAGNGRDAEALASYRRARVQFEALGAETSEDLSLRYQAILVRGSIAEMQARLDERDAARAGISRSLELLDGIAPDPANSALDSWRGEVLKHVAAADAALGASTALGTEERREHWRAAHDLYAQSLRIWRDMEARGILTAEDAGKPAELARDITRCDTALAQIGDVHRTRVR